MAEMVKEVPKGTQGSLVSLDLLDNEEEKEGPVLQDNPEPKFKESLYLDHRDQEGLMEIPEILDRAVQKEKGEKEETRE